MVLTVSFALSPVTGLSCHCRQQVTTCQLDASVGASGPHDFAVREARAFVFRAASRPPQPAPRSRRSRYAPLRSEPAAFIRVIWAEREPMNLAQRHWTGGI